MKKWWLSIVLVLMDLGWQQKFKQMGWGVNNSGVSFGWGQSWSWWWLGGLLLLVLFLKRYNLNQMGWILFITGGMTNYTARLFGSGEVWDYIRLPGVGLWINGADIMIGGGLVLLMIQCFSLKEFKKC